VVQFEIKNPHSLNLLPFLGRTKDGAFGEVSRMGLLRMGLFSILRREYIALFR